MPIIINPDGQTAHFDTSERRRIAEALWPQAGQPLVNGSGGTLEQARADVMALAQDQGETLRLPALRGRVAARVIVDDLSDMHAMGLTTRIHDETRAIIDGSGTGPLLSADYANIEARVLAITGVPASDASRVYTGTNTGRMSAPWPLDQWAQRLEARRAPHSSDDRVDAMRFAGQIISAAYRNSLARRHASHALVPVSAPQHVPLERFSTEQLEAIDRPIHDVLRAVRKQMREDWDELLLQKVERLYRWVQIPARPYPVLEARWRSMPENPLITEVDRRLDMLIEDGTPYEDVRLFSLGRSLSAHDVHLLRGVLVCYGPGAKEHFVVKTTTINP